MYKCLDCGAVFEEPKFWKEDRGECFGFPSYETMSGCPECEGDYKEAGRCKRCDEWCFEDELNDDLCECCYDELFDEGEEQ